MSSKSKCFFSVSKNIDKRLGDILSFVWVNYVGLKRLVSQVKSDGINDGFFNDLNLPDGINKKVGVDIRKVCLETGWDVHEQEFAKWVLFETCTLYEEWTGEVAKNLIHSHQRIKKKKLVNTEISELSNALQFPIRTNGDDYTFAISDVAHSNKSALIEKEFYPKLKKSSLNCLSDVNDYLIAYRFFKECRNSLIHKNGLVDQRLQDACTELDIIQKNKHQPFNPNSNKTRSYEFNLIIPQVGSKINLSLSNCILLSQLVRRIIITFDAELSINKVGETILKERLQGVIDDAQNKNINKWLLLPKEKNKADERVFELLSTAKIPTPEHVSSQLLQWIRSNIFWSKKGDSNTKISILND